MKRYYGIGEIAALYGLCEDTIRYYEEQGLIRPRRSDSGYRQYTIQDIGVLNVIRNLRMLDMPIADIRSHLSLRTVQNTVDLYFEEERLLIDRITALQAQLAEVINMRGALCAARAYSPMTPCIKSVDQQRGFLAHAKKGRIAEADEDYLLRQLEQRHAGLLPRIGAAMIGSVLSLADVRLGITNASRAVFILSHDSGETVIPAGSYASIVYCGAYRNNGTAFAKLFSYLDAEKLTALGDPMQIYHIDMYETEDENEYVTEILLPIVNTQKI